MNLSDAAARLFFEPRFELARCLEGLFLEAASRGDERLLDQHLQTRSRLLLEPIRRFCDRLSGCVRSADAARIQLLVPLRQRFFPSAFKIVAKVCDGSRDLAGHVALAVLGNLAEALAM